ncbi:hypothetical protein K458DRAFT_291050 [Lentithecium fluviatile CBS 122367]|uniref:DUF4604 domain-containing protein n=1 Tax=Lentithecium fluviatile CBS 122367 TaxID=1168545 RepID=A0A6G1JG69_9PLEO|nr:hypothetical protein K458DRAFT_291050 [Lentithecium fluviatile CBS 122367]
MSFKSKDLSYDDTQPAFLRRLRGELAGDGSGRHENPIPRSKRLKKEDDEDDAPTYVLEDTNQSMTKAEYEAMVADKDAENDAAADGGEKSKETATSTHAKDTIAEVGKPTKKRKAAKVIAEEKEEDEKDSKVSEKKVVKKAKKKGKPVKLSFDDPEE